jgi:hypothetical protein
MASFRKRGPYQWQAQVRKKGHPTQTKTFETRAEAEQWARAIEVEMDKGALLTGVGKVAGFSLHAGVAARADERKKLERLCRNISRPAIAEKRLSLTPNGNIRYQLKTPHRDGTTHVMLLRASCPPPFGPAVGCSKSLPAILSSRWISLPGWRRWCPSRESTSPVSTGSLRRTANTAHG